MTKRDVDRLVQEAGVCEAGVTCRVAAVLFTYRCSIACKHCLFGCAAERPDLVMTPRQCLDALVMLHQTGRVVHVAGGEPMLYWPTLRESLRLAAERDAAPHFIETNCSFAVSDDVVTERLQFMAEHGVRGLYASADPFHQVSVPAERFLRVRRLAQEIFGERNFWGTTQSDQEILSFENVCRDEARFRDYIRSHPPVMVGTAQAELARYLDQYCPDDPTLPSAGWRGATNNTTCRGQFAADTLWELHIDPYGNIQTNCGVILGHTAETSPADLLAAGPDRANRFVQVLAESGPLGLARLAQQEYGFVLPARVTQACELCYVVRRFLRGHHPDVFGPAEVYATPCREHGE